jgi:hypothetical protein
MSCEDFSEQSDICVYDLERGVTTARPRTVGTDRFPVWSRDGKTLAYRAGDAAHIFEAPADASSSPRRLANLTGVPSDWSEDGRLFVLFARSMGRLRSQPTWWRTASSGPVGSGSEAQFSPDGRWLL